MSRDSVLFYLNGQRHEVRGDLAFKTVAEYLRYNLGLVGTKVVCAEGDCGACTIMKAFPHPRLKGELKYEAINSCIALVAQMDGCNLVSIEGLKKGDELSPVQKGILNCHGSQCGYCTPGFVMAMTWMIEKNKKVDEKCAKNHLTGNLCRCTGYQPIIDAAISAAKEYNPKDTLASRYISKTTSTELKKTIQTSVSIETTEKHFFAPTSLKELAKLRKKYPKSTIIGAATDLGVQYNKGKNELAHLISLQLIPELYELKVSAKKAVIGARVTLAELRRELEKYSANLASTLDLFASPQIKNSATLVGNVANASPIADTPPILLALGAEIEILQMKNGKQKWFPLSEFFIGYRKTLVGPGDVVTAIRFDLPGKGEQFRYYKNSARKDLDIACVNASVWVKRGKKSQVEDIRVAFGGVAAMPIRLKKVEGVFRGEVLVAEQIDLGIKKLHEEITPISDLRGTQAYRRVLAENVLRSLLNEFASS